MGEAVAIKLSIGDSSKLNLNSKIEYNRCLIPDINALESKEETEEEHRMNEMVLKLREKGTKLWESWKKKGGGGGLREARRLPRMTPAQLLGCNIKELSMQELEQYFREEPDVPEPPGAETHALELSGDAGPDLGTTRAAANALEPSRAAGPDLGTTRAGAHALELSRADGPDLGTTRAGVHAMVPPTTAGPALEPAATSPTPIVGPAESGGREGANLVPSQQVCGGYVYREGHDQNNKRVPVCQFREPVHALEPPTAVGPDLGTSSAIAHALEH